MNRVQKTRRPRERRARGLHPMRSATHTKLLRFYAEPGSLPSMFDEKSHAPQEEECATHPQPAAEGAAANQKARTNPQIFLLQPCRLHGRTVSADQVQERKVQVCDSDLGWGGGGVLWPTYQAGGIKLPQNTNKVISCVTSHKSCEA